MNPFDCLIRGDWYTALTIFQRIEDRDNIKRAVGSSAPGRQLNMGTIPAWNGGMEYRNTAIIVPAPDTPNTTILIIVRWSGSNGYGTPGVRAEYRTHADDMQGCIPGPACPHRLHVETCDGGEEYYDHDRDEWVDDECEQCSEYCDCPECQFGHRICLTHGSHPIFY